MPTENRVRTYTVAELERLASKLHSHPQWTEIERNAKKFAALLLMPTHR